MAVGDIKSRRKNPGPTPSSPRGAQDIFSKRKSGVRDQFRKLSDTGGTSKQWRQLANRASKSGSRPEAMRAKALGNMAAQRGGKLGADLRSVPRAGSSQMRFSYSASARGGSRGGASSATGGSGGGS